MLDCLRMANLICRFKAFGDAGNPWRDDDLALMPLRFGSDIEAVIANLGDLDRIVGDAQSFAQIGTGR
jgi:hypothetical protein